MDSIYLDHNSTTPMLPEVIEAVAECSRLAFANPASQHEAGREARRRLEEAREGIARLLGAQTEGLAADRLIFTSGGTEANNLALLGLVPRTPCRVVVSAIEHPSVQGAADELARRGYEVCRLRVTSDGVVDVAHLEELLGVEGVGSLCPAPLAPVLRGEGLGERGRELHTFSQDPSPRPSPRSTGERELALISVMLGNNETGVVQPIARIAEICAAAGAALHTDAVQAAGKVPVDFRALGAAAMSVAAHKFHGPRGIGALLVRHGVPLEPILFGGFQQAALRPGTEPTALAAGMFKALELWQAEGERRTARLTELRDRFERTIVAALPEASINGEAAPRLPHTSNVAFPGLDRQALVMALDLAGVACSTGSACASGSSEPSPVLLAMGCLSDVVAGSLRFSWGALTTAGEIDEAVRRILKVVNDLRAGKESRKMPPTARKWPRKTI